jgi:hypothetical protein
MKRKTKQKVGKLLKQNSQHIETNYKSLNQSNNPINEANTFGFIVLLKTKARKR